MKEVTAKTVDEAIKAACAELGLSEDRLIFEVKEEKRSLFHKSATIAVYGDEDAAECAAQYLKTALSALGIDSETEAKMEDGIIKVRIDSDRNPVLIGRGGKTLQALNELAKLAVSNKFKRRYRVLLDVGGYKEDKYEKITRIAQKEAKRVQASKVNVQLNPMTPDERRIVHNALAGFEHIRTESNGEGEERAVEIIYVD